MLTLKFLSQRENKQLDISFSKGQLQLVAKNKQSPQICHLLEKTKCFLQDVDTLTSFMDKGQHHSITTKLMDFATRTWTVGELDQSDCTLFMHLFALFMGEHSSVSFQGTHHLRIPLYKVNQLDKYQSDFEYVAITCVDDFQVDHNEDVIAHSPNAKFPYYFVIFQQSLLQKKYSVWNNKENVCIEHKYKIVSF
ncbi:hypothetical protein RFI_38182 [Reticulomyxa filosa]|uniref:Uncharacterized protein n=1 Tax=Reticulomyxa filosa TaxID=46433 RepID=X6LEY9_RETFI|nr:hypothetical protein RFI_38182 [Reticulomyxa filosa]|eukprot:ETN99299.1 hypothetical protein RFI_38182 [Reticulomyxa filosa]